MSELGISAVLMLLGLVCCMPRVVDKWHVWRRKREASKFRRFMARRPR